MRLRSWAVGDHRSICPDVFPRTEEEAGRVPRRHGQGGRVDMSLLLSSLRVDGLSPVSRTTSSRTATWKRKRTPPKKPEPPVYLDPPPEVRIAPPRPRRGREFFRARAHISRDTLGRFGVEPMSSAGCRACEQGARRRSAVVFPYLEKGGSW